jgi:hypothetical protein
MKYLIFNQTDGIYASPIEFNTKEAAIRYTEKLRDKYRSQGYYLTSDRHRIPPEAIDYSIKKIKDDKETLHMGSGEDYPIMPF